ncbi:putative membrane protein [Exiguobacterium sp. S17]|nr:putative membrane protein [Exiguobacterium sp. S17]
MHVKNAIMLLTIVSALSSQILPQILYLSVMALEEGVGGLIPFMIFYVASMSGLLLWVYVIGRLGSKQTFLIALWVLVGGLVCFLLPFEWAIELSAFLVGVGSIGVGSIMTTILSQLNELSVPKESTEEKRSSWPLILELIAWIAAFSYTLTQSYNGAVILFLVSLVLPWLFVRKLPLQKTATWTLPTVKFVRAFIAVTLFTLVSRLLSLLEGTRGYIELFLLMVILLGYVGWVLFQERTKTYISATRTRQVQLLAFVVGLFGGWTLIGAVFLSLALYSFQVLLFYVFIPFLAGVIGWVLISRVFDLSRRPYLVLFVSSLLFFLGFIEPLVFIPVLFVSGYVQTMYSSAGHVYLCKYYGDNKEFASLLLQLWKRFGMVVAYSALMVGILSYGLYVGQTVNTELSFQIPRSWMMGVLGLTWLFNVGLITIYWQRVNKNQAEPK